MAKRDVWSMAHDNLLLEETGEDANRTSSGLYIPDSKVKDDTGKPATLKKFRAVEVGPGGFTDTGVHIPMSCKKGDIVIALGKGAKVVYQGRTVWLMRNLDVVCVVTEETVLDDMDLSEPKAGALLQ